MERERPERRYTVHPEDHLAAELSAYKIPKRFAAIAAAEVPLLASGKVDMQQLKRLFDA